MNDIIIQNTAIHAEPATQEIPQSVKTQKLFREYADLASKLKIEKSILSDFYRNDIEYSSAIEKIKIVNAEKKAAKARIEAREIDTCNNITELTQELNHIKEILDDMITYEILDRARNGHKAPLQMSLFDHEGTAYNPVFSIKFTQKDSSRQAASPEENEEESTT
jgi:hypothetical protein